MRNVNDFQMTKFILRVLLSICLSFCQFQTGVAYKKACFKQTFFDTHTQTISHAQT